MSSAGFIRTGMGDRSRRHLKCCDQPNAQPLEAGTVWRAGCGRRWIVVENPYDLNDKWWRRKWLPTWRADR